MSVNLSSTWKLYRDNNIIRVEATEMWRCWCENACATWKLYRDNNIIRVEVTEMWRWYVRNHELLQSSSRVQDFFLEY